MNLKATNNVETNKYELEIEVTSEEFNQAINEVYKKESKKMNIPGFRKGKAPRAFIEKYYGEEVFFEAAVDHLYRPMVMEAVEKSELKVISIGEFKIDEIGKEKGILCKLNVVVKPEVKIDGYKGIEVTKEPVAVTEGDIDAEIERVRERNSRMVNVDDRAAENGDITVIDFDGYVDGKQFDGGKAENYELTLGAGQFIPGFEEQIIGHAIEEEFDVSVKFPVSEYRNDLEKHLLEQRQKAADSDAENQMVDAIIEKVDAVIPEEMIENEIDEMINSFAYRLQSQGLNLETYLKYTGMSTDNLRDQYKLQAERQVKVRLGLEKIAELEDIKPTEEETEAEFEKLAKAYEMPVENVKNFVSVEAINADIANQKVIDFIRENAVITEAKPEKKPAAKKKAAPKKKSAKKEEISEEEKTED